MARQLCFFEFEQTVTSHLTSLCTHAASSSQPFSILFDLDLEQSLPFWCSIPGQSQGKRQEGDERTFLTPLSWWLSLVCAGDSLPVLPVILDSPGD